MSRLKIVTFAGWGEEQLESMFPDYLSKVKFVNAGIRGQISEQETIEAVKNATLILVNPGSPDITREILAAAEKVKLIQSMVVGYDNVDVQAATELGIPVANNPDGTQSQ